MIIYGYKVYNREDEVVMMIFQVKNIKEVKMNMYICDKFKLIDYDILNNQELSYEEYERMINKDKMDDDNIDKEKRELIMRVNRELQKFHKRHMFYFYINKELAYKEN